MPEFRYGPLRVRVDPLGKLRTPWDDEEEYVHLVTVTDDHGNVFEGSWIEDVSAETAGQRMVTVLWSAVEDEDFPSEFSAGYRGRHHDWRRREAYRIRSQARRFDEVELMNAAAIVARKQAYAMFRGIKDWSPKEEMP